MTGIAEGLAHDHDVAVLCGQPTYAARGTRAPAHEVRRGVAIWRCPATTLQKDRLLFRLVNLVTLTISIFGKALLRFQRNDVVVVLTNPPTLPYAALIAARIRGAKCVLLVHDVYPDVLVATGWLPRTSVWVRTMRWLQRALYASMDKIIVIGRDMEALVAREFTDRRGRVQLIPNWADLDDVRPADRRNNALLSQLGLTDKFVVQYSGNMGRTHGIEDLAKAAETLRRDARVHFLFIGGGAKRRLLEATATARGLTNVTLLAYQPREALDVSLNACDLAVISFVPGMAGVSVPSRMYNVMAAGKPIIGVADEQSELAQLIREENIGWVVPPGPVEGIVESIVEAMEHPALVAEMGRRARAAAEAKYSYDRVLESYRLILTERGR